MPLPSQPPPGRPSTVFSPFATAFAYLAIKYGWPWPRPTFWPSGQRETWYFASLSSRRPEGQPFGEPLVALFRAGAGVAGAGELAQLPKWGGGASRRDASSSSANLIARPRISDFVALVFSQCRSGRSGAERRSQKSRRLSKWFPCLLWALYIAGLGSLGLSCENGHPVWCNSRRI